MASLAAMLHGRASPAEVEMDDAFEELLGRLHACHLQEVQELLPGLAL